MNAVIIVCAALIHTAAAENPILSILQPTDTTYALGDTMAVEWTADDATLDNGVVVELSLDDGRNWFQISQGEALPNATRRIEWVVDDLYQYNYDTGALDTISPLSDECVVRVYEYDGNGLDSPGFQIVDELDAIGIQGKVIPRRGEMMIERRAVTVSLSSPYTLLLVDPAGRGTIIGSNSRPASFCIPHRAAGACLLYLKSRHATVSRMHIVR